MYDYIASGNGDYDCDYLRLCYRLRLPITITPCLQWTYEGGFEHAILALNEPKKTPSPLGKSWIRACDVQVTGWWQVRGGTLPKVVKSQTNHALIWNIGLTIRAVLQAFVLFVYLKHQHFLLLLTKEGNILMQCESSCYKCVIFRQVANYTILRNSASVLYVHNWVRNKGPIGFTVTTNKLSRHADILLYRHK
jgi:hypothetical protein